LPGAHSIVTFPRPSSLPDMLTPMLYIFQTLAC
jgi:hypothetical protein